MIRGVCCISVFLVVVVVVVRGRVGSRGGGGGGIGGKDVDGFVNGFAGLELVHDSLPLEPRRLDRLLLVLRLGRNRDLIVVIVVVLAMPIRMVALVIFVLALVPPRAAPVAPIFTVSPSLSLVTITPIISTTLSPVIPLVCMACGRAAATAHGATARLPRG